MLKLPPIAFVTALIAGCATAPPGEGGGGPGMFGLMAKQVVVQPQAPTPAPNPRSDIRIMNSFQPGVSTVTDAVRVLGAPTLVNQSPDGRFVYMYDFPSTPNGPLLAGMLFGPDQKLIKVDYFKK